MQNIKEKVGAAAAALVEDGMIVGLGTGSTAVCFIQALAKRYLEEGIDIVTVASSHQSERLSLELGLPFVSADAISCIDMTFDGADEIDPFKRIIKGAGGALLKEKILAEASKELVIMVDETKCVANLGAALLPVEVVQFAHNWTASKLSAFSLACHQRMRGDGRPFITESQHFIYNLQLSFPIESPETLEQALLHIPGVVETGLFLGIAGRVLIGQIDGTIKTLY